MKLNLSKRDIKLLLMLLGLVALVASFYLVYTPAKERREAIELQNVELQNQVSRLEELNASKPQYEADIVSMATGLASTGELVGLTEPQIFALATAMSSVGIEAAAGSTAMSKLLKKIQILISMNWKRRLQKKKLKKLKTFAILKMILQIL